ncbi:MAG: hypothetical protein ACRBFS_16570 [Aureispira sp.]
MTIKTLLITLLISYTFTLWGQIIYAPVFMDPCSQKEDTTHSWHLEDSLETIYNLEDEDKKNYTGILLPQAGTYQLHYASTQAPILVTVHNKINRDTFFLQELRLIENPLSPFSEFIYCDNPAQGAITTYYYNGNKRAQGHFEKGQPIDTIFYYRQNGDYDNLFVVSKNNWQRINYFETQQIESIYDTKTRTHQTFYPSQQLKSKRHWKKDFTRSRRKEYHLDGSLQLERNHRQLRQYNPQGILVKKIKRKAILVLKRSFAKAPYDRHHYHYAYEWKRYDSTGTLQQKIKFHYKHIGPGHHRFPKEIHQIKPHQFKEIFFYKNGLKVYKIDFQPIQENEEWPKQLCGYRLVNNQWVLNKTMPADQIYEVLTPNKY